MFSTYIFGKVVVTTAFYIFSVVIMTAPNEVVFDCWCTHANKFH